MKSFGRARAGWVLTLGMFWELSSVLASKGRPHEANGKSLYREAPRACIYDTTTHIIISFL